MANAMQPALLVAALSACAAAPVAVPTPDPIPEGAVRVSAVAVRPSAVTLTVSDGAVCVGPRPDGATAGWSGTTVDCPHAIPYVVTFAQGGSPSRFVVEAPPEVSVDGAPGPRAEVFVTDLDGERRLFVVPQPAEIFVAAAG